MLDDFHGVVRKRVLQAAALIAVPLLIALSADAAGGGTVVVGTGTPGSCNEDVLDNALGCAPLRPTTLCSGGYTVTFDCGGPATIPFTRTRRFLADTTIDGGNVITISGGIKNRGGTLVIANSTFTGNSPGIENAGDRSDDTNSTFTDNGAIHGGSGIAGGSVTLANTIMANNAGDNCRAAIVDGGYNLDDGTSCGFSTATHSFSNTATKLDPAGLGNNGGPTRTIAHHAGMPSGSE